MPKAASFCRNSARPHGFFYVTLRPATNRSNTMDKEFEKMRNGETYRFDGGDVLQSLNRAKELFRRLRGMTTGDADYRDTITQLIPSLPPTSTVCPPFTCDHGNGITIGEYTFINANCTMLDSGRIAIGSHVKIGPCCQLYTPNHPFDHIERRKPQERSLPITIGDDTWLGGGVIVCPGVTIGNRCIIAAGAVVTSDIPDDCLAAGNPAKVKRRNVP